jgi:hypothetical protein
MYSDARSGQMVTTAELNSVATSCQAVMLELTVRVHVGRRRPTMIWSLLIADTGQMLIALASAS